MVLDLDSWGDGRIVGWALGLGGLRDLSQLPEDGWGMGINK